MLYSYKIKPNNVKNQTHNDIYRWGIFIQHITLFIYIYIGNFYSTYNPLYIYITQLLDYSP